jgi:hypothetical protein
MNDNTKRYAALIDGVLELAARDLSGKEYRDLMGDVVEAVSLMRECRKSSPLGPCTFGRWHHGLHSWENPDADALVELYRRTRPEGVGKVTVADALAAMRKQDALPPACGFRSLREEARATPDAKVRTGPMCKAVKGTGSGYDICWREDGHREDHDFRPGMVAVGGPAFGGGVIGYTDNVTWRCPHDNVGCGTTRTCEVCKGETKRANATGGGWVQGINFTPPVTEAQANAAMDAVKHGHVCTIRCTGLGAIQCPKAGA